MFIIAKQMIHLSEYVASIQERINENIEQISHIDANIKICIKYITSTLVGHL